MAPEQLTIDGELVPYPLPPPRRLTTRQRALLRFIRADPAPIAARQARHFFADPYGALRRLEALGLVRRRGRGRWEAKP